MSKIRAAHSDAEIMACFPVMAQLRPHLAPPEFVGRVRRQQEDGYHLAYLEENETVHCVAGYRFSESLSWGRFLYVDDLVTAESARSQGHGGQMLDWLLAQAREKDCDQFHLDSGVQRFAAHRFYLMKRMDIIAHHFAIKLR